MVARNEEHEDRVVPGKCKHCGRLQLDSHSLPAQVQVLIVVSFFLIPGFLINAMVQSKHENMRVGGWVLGFGLVWPIAIVTAVNQL